MDHQIEYDAITDSGCVWVDARGLDVDRGRHVVLQLSDRRVEALDVADHQGLPDSLSNAHELSGVLGRAGDRLLDQEVETHLEHLGTNAEVTRGRRCQHDCVDTAGQLAHRRERVCPGIPGGSARSIGIGIHDGREARIVMKPRDADMIRAHDSGADHGNPQFTHVEHTSRVASMIRSRSLALRC